MIWVRPKMDLGCLSLLFSTFFCETMSLSWNWNSPDWLDWLVSEPLGSSCLPTSPPSLGLQVYVSVSGFDVSSGYWAQIPVIAKQALCRLNFLFAIYPKSRSWYSPSFSLEHSFRLRPALQDTPIAPVRTPTLSYCLSCHCLPCILSQKICFQLIGLPLYPLPLWLNLPSPLSITAGHRALYCFTI